MTDTPHNLSPDDHLEERGDRVIDIVKEEVEVGKQLVETGRVQIAKTVVTEDIDVRLEHLEHRVDIQRHAINETFDVMPEGTSVLDDGTVVYRIIREVPVVVTKYQVVEEIRVRPEHHASIEDVVVPIRSERVDVRRTAADPTL